MKESQAPAYKVFGLIGIILLAVGAYLEFKNRNRDTSEYSNSYIIEKKNKYPVDSEVGLDLMHFVKNFNWDSYRYNENYSIYKLKSGQKTDVSKLTMKYKISHAIESNSHNIELADIYDITSETLSYNDFLKWKEELVNLDEEEYTNRLKEYPNTMEGYQKFILDNSYEDENGYIVELSEDMVIDSYKKFFDEKTYKRSSFYMECDWFIWSDDKNAYISIVTLEECEEEDNEIGPIDIYDDLIPIDENTIEVYMHLLYQENLSNEVIQYNDIYKTKVIYEGPKKLVYDGNDTKKMSKYKIVFSKNTDGLYMFKYIERVK